MTDAKRPEKVCRHLSEKKGGRGAPAKGRSLFCVINQKIYVGTKTHLNERILDEQRNVRNVNKERILSIHEAIMENSLHLGQHCRRVADLAFRVAMCLGTGNVVEIYRAALVHDIGKLFIDPAILNKPSALTPDERKQIDRHSVLGYVYLKTRCVPEPIAQMVLLHHGYKKEKYGYSDGKNPNMGADIIRACDIFDAVTSDRVYRKALTPEEAMEILKNQPEPLPEDVIRAVWQCR